MQGAVVLLVTAAAIAAPAAWPAGASYPRPVRACGSIVDAGRAVRVDIAETGGGMKVSCTVARGVMRRYLAIARRHLWPGGAGSSRRLAYEGVRFDCYKSRPDGVGWDYHCDATQDSAARYVDVGAGRRGHLCRSRSGRCPPG